jgi:hypothetical protein
MPDFSNFSDDAFEHLNFDYWEKHLQAQNRHQQATRWKE